MGHFELGKTLGSKIVLHKEKLFETTSFSSFPASTVVTSYPTQRKIPFSKVSRCVSIMHILHGSRIKHLLELQWVSDTVLNAPMAGPPWRSSYLGS